jgi:hypothetical protein
MLAVSWSRYWWARMRLMDRGRIRIADLAKGVIGEDHARLLGALLLSQFQWGAMQHPT